MTAITFYGTPEYQKLTSSLPLAGKQSNLGIAQLAEHLTLDQNVVGSIPTAQSNINQQ